MAGWLDFRDDIFGVALEHPPEWSRLPAASPEDVSILSSRPLDQFEGAEDEVKTVEELLGENLSILIGMAGEIGEEEALADWLQDSTLPFGYAVVEDKSDSVSGAPAIRRVFQDDLERTWITWFVQRDGQVLFVRAGPATDDNKSLIELVLGSMRVG